MMKVQVTMKSAAQKVAAQNSTFDISVKEEELVGKIKERIAASQLIAFPDTQLVHQGKTLEDGMKMGDYGVKENDALEFVICATEESLLKQVAELLQARDLTTDELGLLYCYKHGVSLNQALKTVGVEEKFQEYVKKQKQFSVDSGRVALVREDTALKPFSAAKEVEQILCDGGSPMDVTVLCSKFIQKFNVSLSSIVGMRPAEFLEKEKDRFVLTGRGKVSLKGSAQQPKDAAAPAKKEEKPKPPAPVAPAKKESPPAPAAPVTAPQPAAPVAPAPPKVEAELEKKQESDAEQMYQDLHTKISGRSFNSKIAQTLTGILNILTEKCGFLNVDRIERGGAVGKGTAIGGAADAEVVFFLNGMPSGDPSKWLKPLLKSVATVLEQTLTPADGVTDLTTTNDSVRMKVKDLVTLDLRFSPAFDSHAEAVAALRAEQSAEARKYYAPSFVKEKSQFVGKQPGQVKVTIRLLRWWRDQQSWSSALTRPSDEVLELLAIYSALQTKPRDQSQAVANAMSLMARFSELRIVWSNYYKKEDIWTPLMSHRPLLMDPVNPFVNAADPQSFDPKELMELARTTHFFW